jgi:nucleoside-diphosphate-sugar epimerase
MECLWVRQTRRESPEPSERTTNVSTQKIALVTGVTGHASGAMARELRDAGFTTRVLIRDAIQATAVSADGHEPVHGDLTDAGSLRRAVDGADVVVHGAVYGGADWDTAIKVNVDGTRALAAAALEAGVRRFVHISTISVHGEPSPEVLTEESPLAPDCRDIPYVGSKARAELALGELRAGGLETVVIRPGAICSSTRSQWGDEMVERLRTRGWTPAFHPEDLIPWVHTENVAAMTKLAASHPDAANEVFVGVDENVENRAYLVPIADALGVKVVSPDRAPDRSVCRTGKIHERLGYTPVKSFEETMAELVELARRGPAREAQAVDTP